VRLELMLYHRSRRDDPHVLQPVETQESAADVAAILNHEVMRYVSDLGPEIKQMHAPSAGVRRCRPGRVEADGCPAGPDEVGEWRHVPEGVLSTCSPKGRL
jgi:hypothetical protein